MEVKCCNCQNIIIRKPSYIAKTKIICCSTECMGEYKTKTNTITVKCSQCGEEFIKGNKQAALTNIHFCSKDCFKKYTKEHKTNWKSEKKIKLFKCSNCGKDVVKDSITGHLNKEYKHRFCNQECLHTFFRNNPKESPNYKEGKKLFICDNCSKEFNEYAKDKLGKHIFCSKECKNIYLVGENAHNYTQIEHACDECGTIFKKFKEYFTYAKNDKYFCSTTCMGKHYSGENSHAWKGGISTFVSTIRNCTQNIDWRKLVLSINNTCLKCGSKEDLHVHHKIQFSKILEDNNITTIEEAKNCKELFDLNNGDVLCKTCHYEFHNLYRRKDFSVVDYEKWLNKLTV